MAEVAVSAAPSQQTHVPSWLSHRLSPLTKLPTVKVRKNTSDPKVDADGGGWFDTDSVSFAGDVDDDEVSTTETRDGYHIVDRNDRTEEKSSQDETSATPARTPVAAAVREQPAQAVPSPSPPSTSSLHTQKLGDKPEAGDEQPLPTMADEARKPPLTAETNPRRADALSFRARKVYEELAGYLSDLAPGSSTVLAICEIFASKYNTSGRAADLVQYYRTRQNLGDYTLDTEMPRMNYVLHTSEGVTLTKTADVQHYFRERRSNDWVEEILLRASNQSLLADALEVISGQDRLVRPQLMATALATKCQFEIDLREEKSKGVTAECTLAIGVPSGVENGGRLDLTELVLQVAFRPGRVPNINYKIMAVMPSLSLPEDQEKLESAAEGLLTYSPASRNEGGLFYRGESFVSRWWEAGLWDAWRDMQDVPNVTSKSDFLVLLSL